MIALLDIGNSQIKACLTQTVSPLDNSTVLHWSSEHHLLPDIASQLKTYAPDEIWLSNVSHAHYAEALDSLLQPAVTRQVKPFYTQQSFLTQYDDPLSLGIDRWLAVLGAIHSGHPTCVVIDSGTATTIDVIQESYHRGGYIVPGLQMLLRSLNQSTAQLPSLEPVLVKHHSYPTNTQDGILVGTNLLYQGLLEQLQQAFYILDLQQPLHILTGGAAESLIPLLPQQVQYEVDHDLIFKGMLAYRNIINTRTST